MKKQYIETGKITGTHGIRGEMRVQPWCDTPEDLTRYRTLYLDEGGGQSLQAEQMRVHKSMVIVKAKGIDTVAQAEAYRGKIVYVSRKDLHLAPGRYLVEDLIGCRVLHSENGGLLGELTDVSQTGANDVWHIVKQGQEYLIPAIPSVVKQVEVEKGEIYILPLKGIFEDED